MCVNDIKLENKEFNFTYKSFKTLKKTDPVTIYNEIK